MSNQTAERAWRAMKEFLRSEGVVVHSDCDVAEECDLYSVIVGALTARAGDATFVQDIMEMIPVVAAAEFSRRPLDPTRVVEVSEEVAAMANSFGMPLPERESAAEHTERTAHREYTSVVGSATSECNTCHASVRREWAEESTSA